MAKTHGRSPLPLPEFLLTSLRSAGWVEMGSINESRLFRHPRHRAASLLVVTSNMPGELDTVIAQWRDAAGKSNLAKRVTVDVLVRALERGLKVDV